MGGKENTEIFRLSLSAFITRHSPLRTEEPAVGGRRASNTSKESPCIQDAGKELNISYPFLVVFSPLKGHKRQDETRGSDRAAKVTGSSVDTIC